LKSGFLEFQYPVSADFYRTYDKNILAYFYWVESGHTVGIFTIHDFQVLQDSVETLFGWAGTITILWLQISSGIWTPL